jgi:hypothetical protein
MDDLKALACLVQPATHQKDHVNATAASGWDPVILTASDGSTAGPTRTWRVVRWIKVQDHRLAQEALVAAELHLLAVLPAGAHEMLSNQGHTSCGRGLRHGMHSLWTHRRLQREIRCLVANLRVTSM